ncbi:alpha/beta fold hydrolase [Mycetocola tolaasinivorans]|nr:alpha/beta hydrolase [Mycetocola tolaasinivorans]
MSASRHLPASQILDTAAGPIEYAERGSGTPLIVLHGTPGGFDQGLTLSETIGTTAGIRLISISRPGYLRTPLEIAPGPRRQGALIGPLLDALGLDTAAVAGVSGGGMAALWAAATLPDRISSLILLEALVEAQDISLPAGARYLLTRRGIARAAVTAPVQRVLARGVPGPDAEGWDARAVVRSITASGFPFAPRLRGTESDTHYAAEFVAPRPELVTVPTLIVHGERDRTVPIGPARNLAGVLPRAKFVPIAGADHTGTVPSLTVRREVPAFVRAHAGEPVTVPRSE